jgi:hypothetical protein
VAIDGYRHSVGTYALAVQTSTWDQGMDCDGFFDDASEDGPCNRILQYPQSNSTDDGFVVSHAAHYSALRREVAYLVSWAAAETVAFFEDTGPLGLLDMSQADGDTPGRLEGSLRHPEGTHINGNDIDIAYYQTGDDNLGRVVCENDGYWCTEEPDILDARRTAYFISRLVQSEHVRVIGVDTLVYAQLREAGQELRDEGVLGNQEYVAMKNSLAYGDGWPFHHHHMHFSWDWEDGYAARSAAPVDGCGAADLADASNPNMGKVRAGVGLDCGTSRTALNRLETRATLSVDDLREPDDLSRPIH